MQDALDSSGSSASSGSEQLRAKLLAGMSDQGPDLDENQQNQLLKYLQLMNHWNKKINLTAIHDPAEQVTRHLLDSFSIYPHIVNLSANCQPVLDVGTGAGLPGIPMAIAEPNRQWHLLDNSTKRISFLRYVITQLKITNVELVNSRVENYQSQALYPAIVCRAFASLKEITHNAQHLLADDAVFLAMKGQYPAQEITDMSKDFVLSATHNLNVSGLDEERHLLEIRRRKA